MRLQRCLLWPVSSEGLTGAGTSTSKVANSRGWKVCVGYWQEALAALHRASLQGSYVIP